MANKLIRDIKEVIRRLRNRGISFEGNRQYPAIPTIDNSIESHTNALRAMREAIETHERRNSKAALDSFVRLYELEDVLGGFQAGESNTINNFNGADYIGSNLGAGADVYRDTITGANPRVHRFRSITSNDSSITITQSDNEIDLSTGDGADTGPPTLVDVANLTCGTSTSLTPTSDLTGAQAGDLCVWVCVMADYGALFYNNERFMIKPSGWEILYSEKERTTVGPGAVEMILYKVLQEADIAATHTVSRAKASGTVCSAAYLYRNYNTAAPFGASSWERDLYRHSDTMWSHPMPLDAESGHILSVRRHYKSSGTGWPITTETEIGLHPDPATVVTKQIGSYHWHMASVQVDYNGDENWVGGETDDSSCQGAGWTNSGLTITRAAGDATTQLKASAASAVDRYIEQSFLLVSGQKYTFAVLTRGYSNQNKQPIGVTYVDPSSNERGVLYKSTSTPSWIESTADRRDPLTDHGTVWRSAAVKLGESGLPADTGGWVVIHFTAQADGIHKVRVYACDADGSGNVTWANGDTTYPLHVAHVLFRSGYHTPGIVWTPIGPVYGGNDMRRADGFGWHYSGFDDSPGNSLHMRVQINGRATLPDTTLDIGGASLADGDTGIAPDKLTARFRARASGRFQGGCARATRPIMPKDADGNLQRRYFEVSVSGASGDDSSVKLGISSLGGGWTLFEEADYYFINFDQDSLWNDAGATANDSLVIVDNDIVGFLVDYVEGYVRVYRNGVLDESVAILNDYAGGGEYALEPMWAFVQGPSDNRPSLELTFNFSGPFVYPTAEGVEPYDTLGGFFPGTTPRLSDGDKGDITVSNAGRVWTIDARAVNFSKMQAIATNRLLGRVTASSGDIEEITVDSFAADTTPDEQADYLLSYDTSAAAMKKVLHNNLRIGVPQNNQTGNYSIQATDNGRSIDHLSGDGASDVYTIPANASVALPRGFTFSVCNLDASAVSVAITSDTMYWLPTGVTGTRSIAQYGVLTCRKVTDTVWVCFGVGVS